MDRRDRSVAPEARTAFNQFKTEMSSELGADSYSKEEENVHNVIMQAYRDRTFHEGGNNERDI